MTSRKILVCAFPYLLNPVYDSPRMYRFYVAFDRAVARNINTVTIIHLL